MQYAVMGDPATAEREATRTALARALAAARTTVGRSFVPRDLVAVLAAAPDVDRVSRAPHLAVTVRVRAVVRLREPVRTTSRVRRRAVRAGASR
ncbi:MAG: hypothetical protein NVS1B2_01650 [Vulcanimicrobiaceae bacterium]